MAKKRRDKERDPSSVQRVAKFAGAALGVGIGAASLYRKGGINYVAAGVKTAGSIKADLVGKKATAKNIEATLKKRIGKNGKHYKDLVKSYSDGSKKVKFNTKKTRDIFGIINASKQSYSNREILKSDHLSKNLAVAQKQQIEALKKRGIEITDKQEAKLNVIMRDAFSNVETTKGAYKVKKDGKEFITVADDFHKDGFSSLGEDINKFKEEIITTAYNARKKADESLDEIYKSEQKKFLKDVSNAFLDKDVISSRLKKKDTDLLGRTSKLINKTLGTDIDLSQAFHGSRKATLGDLYDEFKSGRTDAFDLESIKGFIKNEDAKGNYEKTNNFQDFMDLMKDNLEELKDVHVGSGVRVREKMIDGKVTKEFYSTSEADELITDFMSKVADTLPGRLFKGIDIKQMTNAPMYNIYEAGEIHGFISGKLKHEGEQRLKNTYMSLGKKMYQVIETDNRRSLVDVTEQIGEFDVVSQTHGSMPYMLKNIFGTDRTTANEANKLLKAFDLGQTGQPNLFQTARAYLKKFKNEDWERNQLGRLVNNMSDGFTDVYQDDLDIDGNVIKSSQDKLMRMYEDIKTLDKTLDAYTASNGITDETLTKMLDNAEELGLRKDSQALIRGLLKGDIGTAVYDQEAFEEALVGNKDILGMLNVLSSSHSQDGNITSLKDMTFHNPRLKSLISKISGNTESNLDLLNISSKQSKIPFVADIVTTDVNLIDDVMRREIIKEVLMRETTGDPNKLFDIAQNIGLDSAQERNLKILHNWSRIQKDALESANTNKSLTDKVHEVTSNFVNYFDSYSNDYKSDLSYNINFVAKDRFSIFDKGTFENLSEQYSSDHGQYTAIKKSGLMAMLENLNDFERIKAVGKELVAGRNNAEDISLLTLAPYFVVSRLNQGVADLGIGLSHQSAGSTLDLVKNIALKRIMPIAGALAAYDYLDYEAENILGTSITGAGANAIGNADMAMRKTLDATGLSGVANWLKEPNVIAEYWTGSKNFQTAEERQEWYEDGYSPVRSGRFWSFGSGSEFRGGDIAYYQPNFVKRANSNWREIGIYGSAEDKFKHSLLPSLRHPFSTIDYLLDPYWLEKKNMDSRPYPYTGKMFSEGTPWGAVLNPTIGEIIKPVRMLPEIRERLGSGTIDAKQILHRLNQRTMEKASANDDMIVVNGTDIRNAVYTPYAYATPGETLAQVRGDNVNLAGVDYMNDAPMMNSDGFVPVMQEEGSGIGLAVGGNIVSSGDIGYTGGYANSFLTALEASENGGGGVLSILKTLNANIKEQAAGRPMGISIPNQNGVHIYNNPVGNMITAYNNFYEQRESGMAKSTGRIEDFANDAKHSMKQLSGIYGFLGDFAFGEQSYSMKLADAGQMTSFTRGFWDSNIGGLGGGFMEIARRFFPSEDRSRVAYNPLRNNMEQWLPERFLTGDAYASIPKGEMRLPGKGYESIHELHPDMFGQYGAFDRMKILGDIAPSSEEYKTWRKIAQQTVTDPNLIKKMKDIDERAQKSMDDHDFYERRYTKHGTEIKKGVVSKINADGTITMHDGNTISLAGAEILDAQSLTEFIGAGDVVNYRVTANERKRFDNPISQAIVYKDDPLPFSSININKEMIDAGFAEAKIDGTGLSHLATASAGQEVIGAVFETIAHAPIPFIHNKFMKIESSLESYKNEILYGSSFQTWDNPIEGFVKPAFKQQFRKSTMEEAVALGSWYAFNKAMKSDSKFNKLGATAALVTTNPAALLGGGIGWGLKMGFGEGYAAKGAHIGAALGHIGWGIANADNPLKAATAFGSAAFYLENKLELGDYLSDTKFVDTASDILAKIGKSFDGSGFTEKTLKRLSTDSRVLGTMVTIAGVGLGLGVSALKNASSIMDGDGFSFNDPYIPDDVKERWEMDEYFDRLSYIKYMGLYEEAGRRAERLEGSNIRKIFAKIDKNKKEIAKLQNKAQKLSNKYTSGSPEYQAEINRIQEEIQSLQMSEQVFNGGKWTKAAVAYKKMAESTIYGLSETATMDEILRATPEAYKDYVKAFSKETNQKKREEILELSSPYMRKLLNVAWGEKASKIDSNLKYFGKKKLPNMAWKGWKPNVNMKHVKMKTIENEGMLLSDFGFYESEKSKAAYYEAPDIENYDSSVGGLFSRANIMTAMSGYGLSIDNVSVEKTSAPGLWIVGDVTQNINDGIALAGYGARSLGNGFINSFL